MTTLAGALFLFISLGVLFELTLVLGVNILFSPQEEEVEYSFWGQRCTNSPAHSSQISKPFPDIIVLCQGYCWLEKTQTRNSAVLWRLMRPSSTLKFQFVFCFNWMSLSNFFIIKIFEFPVDVWLLISRHK